MQRFLMTRKQALPRAAAVALGLALAFGLAGPLSESRAQRFRQPVVRPAPQTARPVVPARTPAVTPVQPAVLPSARAPLPAGPTVTPANTGSLRGGQPGGFPVPPIASGGGGGFHGGGGFNGFGGGGGFQGGGYGFQGGPGNQNDGGAQGRAPSSHARPSMPPRSGPPSWLVGKWQADIGNLDGKPATEEIHLDSKNNFQVFVDAVDGKDFTPYEWDRGTYNYDSRTGRLILTNKAGTVIRDYQVFSYTARREMSVSVSPGTVFSFTPLK